MLFWRDKFDLWSLITPPSVWAIHFLFCYVVAAVVCAKFGMQADLGQVRTAIIVATGVAAGLILASAAAGYRRWSIGSELPPYDHPTSENRVQFLGVSTFLVSCLSLVGVIFVALPVLFITDCR